MKRFNFLKITFLMLVLSSLTFAFRLEGINFNQRMDGEGGYREFEVINDNIEKQRYKVNVLAGTKNDASKFIDVYPKVMTIDAKSKAKLKVFAKAPSNAEKGLYSFMLEFKPIGIPVLAKEKKGVVRGTSNVNISPVIEMYGYVGEINFQDSLSLENISFSKGNKKDEVKVEFELSNNSYAMIELGILAYGKNDYLFGSSYLGTFGKVKGKKLSVNILGTDDSKKIKKLALYRTVNDTVEVLKIIPID